MILGLVGYARSGKNTVAEILRESYGFQELAFADPIREALWELNPIVDGTMWVYLHEYFNHFSPPLTWDDYRERGSKAVNSEIRSLLQRLGTDVGRKLLGIDVWVNILFDKINTERTVITDVRFFNEVKRIRESGGKIIRVTRPNVGPANDHESETELDALVADHLIRNDGTPRELKLQVAGGA